MTIKGRFFVMLLATMLLGFFVTGCPGSGKKSNPVTPPPKNTNAPQVGIVEPRSSDWLCWQAAPRNYLAITFSVADDGPIPTKCVYGITTVGGDVSQPVSYYNLSNFMAGPKIEQPKPPGPSTYVTYELLVKCYDADSNFGSASLVGSYKCCAADCNL